MGSIRRRQKKKKIKKRTTQEQKARAKSVGDPQKLLSTLQTHSRKAQSTPSKSMIGSTGYFLDNDRFKGLTFKWERNGFSMPAGIQNPQPLEQANVKNLVFALSIDKVYKARLHIQSLLIETFRVMNDGRSFYNLDDESKEAKLSFYQQVLAELLSRGHLAGYLGKSCPSTSPEEISQRLEVLDPHTLLIVVEVHIHARPEFRKYADDRQELIIKKPATVGQEKCTRGGDDLDLDGLLEEDGEADSMVVVDGTENKDNRLSGVPDFRHHDYSKHSKLDDMLLVFVDQCIEWLEQEKGYAVDEALLRSMSLF